jgi:NAD(P)H dehydrogenase (quinone)
MIAVLGATGRVGSLIAAELAEQGADARAIVREPRQPCPLKVRQGDLTDPPSVRRALRGATRLLLLTPNTPDQPLLEANALDAAVAAGVQHIVKISGGPGTLGPNGTTSTAVAHWRSEQAIERSGLGFTLLRPSFYAQNLLDTVAPAARALGVLPAPFGHAAIAMVDVRDVAACAVAALVDPEPTDRAWHLTGQRPVTLDAIAGHLGMRPLRITPQIAAKALRRRGADASEIDHAVRMATYLAAGGDAVATDHVTQLTGRPARPIEAYLDEHAAAFAPSSAIARTLTRLTTKEHR